MRNFVVGAGPLLAALALGCTGAAKWSVTCGCAPLGAAVILEVPLDLPKGNDSMTPEAMREWFMRRFASAESLSVEDVRALGPLSNHWCSERPLGGITCVYWMWESDDGQIRGIEVSLSKRQPIDVQARYVVDRHR